LKRENAIRRGLKDTLVVVIDGLTGFPEAISAVYPDCEIMGAGADRVQLTTYPQSPFRAGTLLRRNGPVPGILATHQPGAIMDKSGRRFVVRFGLGRAKKQQTQTQPKAKTSTISASY
jgi:hypothetical protein